MIGSNWIGSLLRAWLVAVVALPVAPAALAAQAGPPLRVTPLQALAFGDVFPGLPEQVLRTDPLRAGQYRIQGRRNAEVQLTFVLPSQLQGPGTAQLPITFAPDDAGYGFGNSPTGQSGFDPNSSITFRLPGTGSAPRALISLGGTLFPAASQPAGDYSAPATLTVAYTGN